MAKKISEERSKIHEEVQKRFQEETRLKELEQEQLINSLKRANEDLTRKLAQGSQQAQGEAVEEDIENTLTTTFFTDEIIPIKKGVKGGDIHQRSIMIPETMWFNPLGMQAGKSLERWLDQQDQRRPAISEGGYFSHRFRSLA